MTKDAELMTGNPRCHSFILGTSSLGLFFYLVEVSRALSRDVLNKNILFISSDMFYIQRKRQFYASHYFYSNVTLPIH